VPLITDRAADAEHCVDRSRFGSDVCAAHLEISIAQFRRAVAARQGGFARDEIDGSTGRVAPVERALRATQNFDPLQVEHLCAMGCTECKVGVVDVDTYRRCLVGRIVVAKTHAS
jgi:hypothetical protein